MRAEGATEVSPAASVPASETPANGEGATPATPAVSLSPTVRVRTDTLDRFLSAVGEVILSSSQLRTGVARYASDPKLYDWSF